MKVIPVLLVFIMLFQQNYAQIAEVRADYNSTGDCVFSAQNNSNTPVFLSIDFADLQNTTFNETLPYIKKLSPGFNSLFTLFRDPRADVPRFNYQIKSFRSDPFANVNLDFPYLVPFEPGSEVVPFDVKTIEGFWGNSEPKSWNAVGFIASPGSPVYSVRKGEIVEIVEKTRTDEPQFWYHAWTYAITVLQSDGTLVCYKNVTDKTKKWKVNNIVQAGEQLGEIHPGSNELVLLFYKNIADSDDLNFLIPQFLVEHGVILIVHPALKIKVNHPNEVRALEMTKKEVKKYLGSK